MNSSYLPYNYEKINISAGSYNPSVVKAYNNRTFGYWCRSLFHRLTAVFEFENMPDQWGGTVRDFWYWCLIRYGYVAVFDRMEYGLMFQPCNIYGISVYYQPTSVIVSNPAFNDSFELTLGFGGDAELVKFTPDFLGVWDIIERYAAQLSGMDNSLNSAIVNSKFAWLLGAKCKSAAEAIKKALDRINKGDPAVVVDSKLISGARKPGDDEDPWLLMDFKIKDNYILSDLLQDFQTIINNFDAEIGIPTIPYQKKERMVTAESTMRTYDGAARSLVWFDCLTETLDHVNEHFGSNIKVSMRYPDGLTSDESEVSDDGNS